MLKYVFSFYNHIAGDDQNKTLRENAKKPSFLTFDTQFISHWGLNVRLEYWSVISSEDSGLELSRFWLHLAIPMFRGGNRF
jgi:hypothetical protein